MLFAKLTNADDWEETADFAEHHEVFCKKIKNKKNYKKTVEKAHSQIKGILPDK